MKSTTGLLSGLALVVAMAPVGWLLWQWLKKSDEPLVLLVRWGITVVTLGVVFTIAVRAHDEAAKIGALIVSLFGGVIMIFVWRQRFCDFVGDQFASLYTGGRAEAEPAPCYSFAEARRKKGDYAQAIAEVRVQLEKFPTDFRGWMLLAEIQADNLKDLAAARSTLDEILGQEGHSPKNIAYALNRLADWHLKLCQDSAGARVALEQVVERLPDSEQAQFALQRIAHLGGTQARMDSLASPSFRVQRGVENVGLLQSPVDIRPADEDPAVTAGNYVKHLEQFPYDNDAREKLALVYARHYQRLDLAADQLEQLISFPNQPARQVVHWLNLLADLHIEFGADIAGARQALQRIIDLYPKSAAAENASNRLTLVKLELRGKKQSQAVKLGSYDQNIGLKGGGPPPRG